MNYEIENRVSKSPIKTIDLEDFIGDIDIVVFDIKCWLKDDLILDNSKHNIFLLHRHCLHHMPNQGNYFLKQILN